MLHQHRIEVKTHRDELKQKKLTDIFFSSNKTTSLSSTKGMNTPDERFILNRRLTIWLCKDLLPFKLIENKGFVDFWLSLGFDLKLPTRQTIAVSGLDDIYECLKAELIIKLSNKNIGILIFSLLFQNFSITLI